MNAGLFICKSEPRQKEINARLAFVHRSISLPKGWK